MCGGDIGFSSSRHVLRLDGRGEWLSGALHRYAALDQGRAGERHPWCRSLGLRVCILSHS